MGPVHAPTVLAELIAWELLHRLTREEVIEYLDVRQQQGFNGVLTVVIPELE